FISTRRLGRSSAANRRHDARALRQPENGLPVFRLPFAVRQSVWQAVFQAAVNAESGALAVLK
ncbi:MAG: hypothetical protein ACFNS8_07710, partial [Kingella oralis]